MRRATFLCLVALGCGKVAQQHACDGGGCRGAVTTFRWDAKAPQELDLLLVIDPRALAADGASVRAGLARLAGELPKFPSGLDAHVAMVSSVLDAAGEPITLLAPAARSACGAKDEPYLNIAALTCGAATNFDGTATDAFACLVESAPDGASQPLEVIRRVTGADPGRPPGPYARFRRPRAVLLAAIISARDDASTIVGGDPASLGAYLDGLAVPPGNPGRVVISLIVPFSPAADAGAPGCALAAADTPAPARLLALSQLQGPSPVIDLCRGDWTAIFSALSFGPGRLVFCGPPGTLDRDPVAAGLQPDCLGRLVDPDGKLLAAVPPCAYGPRPCLEYQPDDICEGAGFNVNVDYDCYRPRGTVFELACSTAP